MMLFCTKHSGKESQLSHKKTTDGGISRAISRLAALAARVEYRSTLPSLLACKTRHCHTIHPPVFAQSSAPTSRLYHPVLNTALKGGAAWRHARFACAKQIWQNHFFKIQFSSAEKLEKTDVFLFLWDICVKSYQKVIFWLEIYFFSNIL